MRPTPFFEPPLPSLLPPDTAVFVGGIRVTNAIHADVAEGTFLIYDYDKDGRILRDMYGVPSLIACHLSV